VALLAEPLPEETLVEPVDELDVLLLEEVVEEDASLLVGAPVAMTTPRVPAERMPSPARIEVMRRALRRPASRRFMRGPFVGCAASLAAAPW
jgi:hypothetical protein